MTDKARLSYDGREYEMQIVEGTEHERAIDISHLRADTGLITLDDGYANTGSCKSEITFIHGEEGILRHRGYPIEQLAEQSTFLEVAYLVIFGELPTRAQLDEFRGHVIESLALPVGMAAGFEGFPKDAHPMAILSAMINAAGQYEPFEMTPANLDKLPEAAARLMGRVAAIAAKTYRRSIGQPFVEHRSDRDYAENFLHMLFSRPGAEFSTHPTIAKALDMLFILHADHEQNCSTSTVRMVGSSQANLFASVAAGVCALWGPLHGGANQRVIEMLQQIHDSGQSPERFLERVKSDPGVRLMGFGHRVYKNYDPRARLIKSHCDEVLKVLGRDDPLLHIAERLEQAALKDEYFVERRLYPNVDFYSGIILRAIGIPVNMFTVMFAIGRTPGWIANWYEVHKNPRARIYRPRQVYVGPAKRDYVPIEQRG